MPFDLISEFSPRGDQPAAIDRMSELLCSGSRNNVLLGVTGSGKTFTMAHILARIQKPGLILAPNKTLAAQLYAEFKSLFPHNAVEYFVSYYDYYQPEAYIPTSDTYIQKDSSINELIDKLRHSATMSVLTRRDVIVVASVSCIYGLGAPEDYLEMRVELSCGMEMDRDALLRSLVSIQYERNDMDFHRGVFRVRGDRVEIFPAYEEDKAVRVDFFGDEIEAISEIDPLRGMILKRLDHTAIFPASHYVTKKTTLRRAVSTIMDELKERIAWFRSENRLIEAQRIEERTNLDVEMMMELGYCNGIENYSRHLTGRSAGEPPPTLLDYFPEDFVTFFDESHISLPQIRGMYLGDRSRKETLVKYGFRLPSALDNRPLTAAECESRISQAVYVSATPAEEELRKSSGAVVELIVRPTGLVDPEIEVRPATHQVDNLLEEIRIRIEQNERVLVTTLTKRMAEDLTEYYADLGIRVQYLHSDITTIERMEIIRNLRMGVHDVLVGINLLREGLDIPEVSLVAVLDADKEGFLRSTRSLIQTCGRAARNVHGKVILYADRITESMQRAMDETGRRRKIQVAYNRRHGIVPETITKEITRLFSEEEDSPRRRKPQVVESLEPYRSPENLEQAISDLENLMEKAARDLEFEKAIQYRDQIRELRGLAVFEGWDQGG
jgi:excinuclease ABC subunit B